MPNAIASETRTKHRKAVLGLIRKAAKNKMAAPSNKEMAKAAGITLDNARHAVAELQRREIIRIVKRGNQNTRRFELNCGSATGWTKCQFSKTSQAPRPRGPKVVTSPRKCLSCGKTFESWGVGNRICLSCKTNEAWRDGHDEFAFHSDDRVL